MTPGDRQRRLLFVATSLFGGFLNVAVAMLRHPVRGASLAYYADVTSLGVGALLLVQVCGWPVLTRLAAKRSRSLAHLAVCQATFLATLAATMPLLAFLRVEDAGLLGVLALATALLLLPVAAALLTLALPTVERFTRADALLAAPLVGLAVLVVLWLQLSHIDGKTSPASVASVLGFLLATLAIFYSSRRLAALGWSPRVLLGLLVLTLLSPAPALITETLPRASDPNPALSTTPVILVTIDTLRADALTRSVAGRSATPYMDRLLADSVVFTHARSPAPWTRPAVASILTGLSPLVHGTNGVQSQLQDALVTLPEYLSARGYVTAAIGSNPVLRSEFNFDQGFLDYRFFPGPPRGPSFGGRLLETLLPREAVSTSGLTDATIQWLRQRDRKRPFFLWLHYFDPHLPYSPPKQYLPSDNGPGASPSAFGELQALRSGHRTLSPQERDWVKSLYDAEVSYVDFNVGAVLAELRRQALYEQALVLLTSDHGEEFFEHEGFEHGHSLYDELLRVPLVIKLPGAGVSLRVDAPVSTTSVTPTVLDVLRISVDGPFSTPSLAPLWQSGTRSTQWPPLVSTGTLYYEERLAVLFDGIKYIYTPVSGREELYDIGQDPLERAPLADRPALLARGRRILEERVAQAQDARSRLGLAPGSEAAIDSEHLRQLRALGYVR